MSRELLAAAYGDPIVFDLDDRFIPSNVEIGEETEELDRRLHALGLVLPDLFEEPALFFQMNPSREDPIDVELIFDNFENIRERTLEVMWRGFQRALEMEAKLDEIRLTGANKKVDMPVAGMAHDAAGVPLTAIHVSLDNELDDPSIHTEHGIISELKEDRSDSRRQYLPDVVLNLTQPQCYACTGMLYYYKPGGTVIGSRNADIPSVARLYTPGKQTMIEESAEKIRNGKPTYAEPFILDMGLVGLQAALHLGFARNSYNNRISHRPIEETLELLYDDQLDNL